MMALVSTFALFLLGSTVSAAALFDMRADTVTNITMAVGNIKSLKSPNFPQNYPANVRSQWEYTCPTEASNVLLLTCSVFDLEPSTDCVWDRLIVTSHGKSELKCGSNSPDGTYTATGWMRLTFFSNANNVQGNGFDCSITCMPSPKEYRSFFSYFWASLHPATCGTHVLTAGQVVAIQSTNFPFPYANNEGCQWVFSCPIEGDHTLSIKCPVFKLEHSTDCAHDRLVVATSAGRDVKCGTDTPDGIVAPTGWARFKFVSNADTVNWGFRCFIKCE